MNYEEKYKDALDLARTYYEGYIIQGHNGEAGILEDIFTELKESEDERIRKELIQLISYMHDADHRKKDWIDWLEKQAKKQGKSALEAWKDMRLEVYQQASGNRHEPNYSDDSTKMFSLNDIDEIIEKISEQKPTDKVESKFHPGDWVIDNIGDIYQIEKATEIESKHIFGYTVVGGGYFNDNNDVRLWTINDAKDGDVLVNGSNIFIFHFINSTRLMGYCHVNIDNGRFYDDIGRNECFCLIDAVVTPATKEQHDLFFAKMKEAGYEWDDEKKVVKKIEPKIIYSDVLQELNKLKEEIKELKEELKKLNNRRRWK